MTFDVHTTGLGVRFGDLRAIDDLSVTFPAGVITGLLGRNGAGKSTLMSVLAGYRPPNSGTASVDGAAPFEDPRLMSEICLVREVSDLEPSLRVAEAIELAASVRPRWDQAYADRLVDRFGLALDAKVGTLSRGAGSALLVIVGLAARAPLTMFDEPHLGMDPTMRYAFYEELLEDYGTHPRTVVVSTHLIDEAVPVIEHVVMIDHGRLLTSGTVDELVQHGVRLTGQDAAVGSLTDGLRVLHDQRLGRTRSAVVVAPFGEVEPRASQLGVDAEPLPLQDLFVHLTSEVSP
jgi:ABC-2 type transport system ATP-binding protein